MNAQVVFLIVFPSVLLPFAWFVARFMVKHDPEGWLLGIGVPRQCDCRREPPDCDTGPK